jgi:hypothetical protein
VCTWNVDGIVSPEWHVWREVKVDIFEPCPDDNNGYWWNERNVRILTTGDEECFVRMGSKNHKVD